MPHLCRCKRPAELGVHDAGYREIHGGPGAWNRGLRAVCGQHTREIMHDYGFEDAEIDKLIDAKAVFEEHWVD